MALIIDACSRFPRRQGVCVVIFHFGCAKASAFCCWCVLTEKRIVFLVTQKRAKQCMRSTVKSIGWQQLVSAGAAAAFAAALMSQNLSHAQDNGSIFFAWPIEVRELPPNTQQSCLPSTHISLNLGVFFSCRAYGRR
jgi:hypothetical protein